MRFSRRPVFFLGFVSVRCDVPFMAPDCFFDFFVIFNSDLVENGNRKGCLNVRCKVLVGLTITAFQSMGTTLAFEDCVALSLFLDIKRTIVNRISIRNQETKRARLLFISSKIDRESMKATKL